MEEETNSSGLITSTIAWWKQPFKTNGSALNWVLFFGLAIVAVWFWSHVLLMLHDEA